MFPKLVEINGFFVPTYGFLVAVAFLVGLWVTTRLARRTGANAEVITNLAIYCALAGIVGAKLFLFLFDAGYYLQNPGEILSLSTLQAGGVFHGGLILALITAIYYMRANKLSGFATADLFAPGLALGHAIGRIGCFAAGCCWGSRCDRSWAVTFTNPHAHDIVGVPLGVPLHPSQLYEAGAELLIFGILYRAIGRPHRPGSILGLYLVLYSIARFLVEFVRAHEQPLVYGLSLAQWIAAGLFVTGAWLVYRRRHHQVVATV
jgi:prolipoprotein diacylglyceryl transferase